MLSLCNPGCAGTHFLDQDGFELRDLPASAFQVLGLKMCTWMEITFFLPKQSFIFRSSGIITSTSAMASLTKWKPLEVPYQINKLISLLARKYGWRAGWKHYCAHQWDERHRPDASLGHNCTNSKLKLHRLEIEERTETCVILLSGCLLQRKRKDLSEPQGE